VKVYVGITDRDWLDFLAARIDLDEVNFWQPGGSRLFRALSPGEPFLFKLHSPENFIVGGGHFGHASLAPTSLAWAAFGEGNGARSLSEMRARVAKYRRRAPNLREDYTIGCILLQSPFFFRPDEWIPVPEGWHRNLVQGRGYDLEAEPGRSLWRSVTERLELRVSEPIADAAHSGILAPALAMRRIGQGTFRILITDAYERRCAATGERALPVLEASHIVPVADGGGHEPSNGLLLRSDLHRLFDSGYLTVGPDYRIHVSRRLKDDFDNGEPYYPLHGATIALPRRADRQPDRRALEWHADTVFRR
jgi:putative restriction endonuclease